MLQPCTCTCTGRHTLKTLHQSNINEGETPVPTPPPSKLLMNPAIKEVFFFFWGGSTYSFLLVNGVLELLE